jgi:hypothetical protein
MRVYLFDTNSGLYEGEDFWETSEATEAEGVTNQPPPKAQPGQLPVYDRASSGWRLVSAETLKKTESRNE